MTPNRQLSQKTCRPILTDAGCWKPFTVIVRFLGRCFEQESAFVQDFLARGADAVFADLIAAVEAEIGQDSSEAHVMSFLRRSRQRVALLVGLADMAGIWPIGAVTLALSKFADSAVRLAVSHMLRSAAARGGLELADSRDP